MSLPPPAIASSVDGLSNHKHCEACGTSIGLDGRVCSTECVAKFNESVRMRRRSVYIFVGLMAVMLFLGMLSSGYIKL